MSTNNASDDAARDALIKQLILLLNESTDNGGKPPAASSSLRAICALGSETTVADFYTKIYLPRKAGSSNRHRLYSITIRKLDRCLGRVAVLADINDDVLAQYREWGMALELSPYTVNKELEQLLAIGRFAARKRLLDEFPDVAFVKEPQRIPKAWTAAQMHTLLTACAETPGFIDGVEAGDWWVALHLVLWDSGERIGAVLALTWDDIDLNTGWLIIPAQTRKGGNEDKAFRLHPETLVALQAIAKPERKTIFQWTFDPLTLYLHYNRILKRAGLPTDRKSKFHRIRRSVASHSKAAGLNPTEILGHSSPRITKTYLDPRIGENVQPSDVLFRPTGGA